MGQRKVEPAFFTPSNFFHAAYIQINYNGRRSCRIFSPTQPRTASTRDHQPPHFKVSASVDGSQVSVDPVLEGDLVAYREHASPTWRLGAVVEIPNEEQYHVRSLCSRDPPEEGSLECFVDWDIDATGTTIGSDIYDITVIGADYEERVVQDRLANPHGEIAEECWRISTQLLESLKVVIPRA